MRRIDAAAVVAKRKVLNARLVANRKRLLQLRKALNQSLIRAKTIKSEIAARAGSSKTPKRQLLVAP